MKLNQAPAALAVAACLSGLATATGATPLPGCAEPTSGGEWRLYGHDLRNTRSQPQEEVIDVAKAAALEKAWHFQVSSYTDPVTGETGSGLIESTPIVADGCVYFGTTDGWVFALNADTGDVAWAKNLPVGDPGLLCTGIVGSTAVKDGRVYVIVSEAAEGRGTGTGPYAVALAQQDGSEIWRQTIDDLELVYNCASPVPYEDILIAPFNGDQTGQTNRGGWTIFDAATGEELVKTYTIPNDEFDEDHRGGGVWATPAVDEETGYAYVGTSNPDAGGRQHPHTDAILKFDAKRERDTFGQIVGAYQGTPDRYLPLSDPPTCVSHEGERVGPSFVGRDGNVYLRSIFCMQMDLDFGASPTIFERPDGMKLVGEFQKAGIYHMVRADTMDRVWQTILAPPLFYANASTPATDGESVFVGASLPGHVVSLDVDYGAYDWVSLFGDGLHYNGVAYANGLVYTTDSKGFLNIYRAEDGVPVAYRPMHADVLGLLLNGNVTSGSVSIARNNLYAAANEFLIAYQPPEE